jgi:hypothetical protein
MASRPIGPELNQLSRLLFDDAASNWYMSAGIEIIAGILGAVLSIMGVSDNWALLGAIVGLALFAVAYYLRLRFEDKYDRAETMRRQSVLTEALDWPVEPIQASEWRRRAGRKVMERFRRQPRSQGYYSTPEPIGSGRLAEMTLESAFWTRHLYGKLRTIVWAIFVLALIVSGLVISIPAFGIAPQGVAIRIATAVYILLPILLTIDLLGWAIRLGRLMSSIRAIEIDLERLKASGSLDAQQVLRLVSEYNCQVIGGFPIHPWIYRHWHDEIHELWTQR